MAVNENTSLVLHARSGWGGDGSGGMEKAAGHPQALAKEIRA